MLIGDFNIFVNSIISAAAPAVVAIKYFFCKSYLKSKVKRPVDKELI